MSLKTRAILVVVVGTALGFGLSFGGKLLAGKQRSVAASTPSEQAQLLAEVMQRVKSEFVEPIDDNVLIESALRGMLSELDPHIAAELITVLHALSNALQQHYASALLSEQQREWESRQCSLWPDDGPPF